MQQTLNKKVEIKGIGLHSGCDSFLVIEPAPENFGIQFYRQDLPDEKPIRALYSNVVDVRNCTCIGLSSQNIVCTIEHLMATLSVLGVDNAKISVNNPEIPILDGSAKIFLEKIQEAGLKKQTAPRKYLKVKKEISINDDKGGSIKLLPAEKLHVCFEIEFPSKIVGHQKFDKEITTEVFTKEIAPSRTFCEKYQVDYLKSIGLIKGGSLENAIVLDGEKILNKEGFRLQNECVNHKVLDVIGDIYTSGYHILAKIVANKSGHYHNNEILKELFRSKDNYEIL
ncbi:MAG: UDP-3-O-[3-hydroxymyristoyl] N-acetylglucosamine deacetylase [Alphaproteobacteria bacterium]|nr:UDP-3-O-[3-hydroxymyristoyl] N-acetylglucosamine deacetylase [Alphaproteobacteria bacterium]